MVQGSLWKATVKSENEEGASLHELPRHPSKGPAGETQPEPANESSAEDDETHDAEEVEHAPGSPESQGSAEPWLDETADVRDDRNFAPSTASEELVKAEDFSDSSSCSTSSPRIKPSPSQSPNLVNSASTARSPSAAAAETGTAHGSPQAAQASSGKGETGGSLDLRASTDQSACEPTQPVTTTAENGGKRRLDGGVVGNDAGMSKRRKGSHGEDASEKENSVAHRQPSDIVQPETGKRSASLASGSGPSANQSQDGMSGVQRKLPSNAGAAPQSAGPSPPPPSPESSALRPGARDTRDASGLPVVSHLEGYALLTMATPRRRYTEWQGK